MSASNTEKSSSGNPLSLVWLRRDLRLHDHAAFANAARAGDRVQPIFIFDTDILKRFKHKDDRRLTLIAQALCAMHETLATKGSGILAFHGSAKELIPLICKALKPSHLIAAHDVEPETVERDRHVKAALEGQATFTLVKDHIVQAAHEVLKEDGTPYKVFTPYSKAWRARISDTTFEERSTTKVHFVPLNAHDVSALPLIDLSHGVGAVLEAIGYRLCESEWSPAMARARFNRFIEHNIGGYKQHRDMMGEDGTSRLSPYLRFGILSVRECARAAAEAEAHGKQGAWTWMNELIWRDFYSMILAHFPRTPWEEFQHHYIGIDWRRDKADFKRFTEGQTGYPIVDAAMRELLTTGVMHNRARMIVASFMTKDLLLDWRMGEEHFAQYLMDYEMASNVGGWQWAASTGTDAQPYFRIFNPVLQSMKFDPEGEYIRRFVPELAKLSTRDIHEPWKKAEPKGYPKPMVDHAEVKKRVLTLFKSYRT